MGKKDARIGEVLMEREGEDQREREVKTNVSRRQRMCENNLFKIK